MKFIKVKGSNMKYFLVTIFVFMIGTSFSSAQSKMEDDISLAYQNAKKGIYWALTNIPEKKSKLDEDLIADDKLYSSVKLEKANDGIKIESTGFNSSNEVKITIYKSNETLLKEGYLKPEEEKSKDEKNKK